MNKEKAIELYKKINERQPATISDVIETLTKLKEQGFGGYVIIFNNESVLLNKGESLELDATRKLAHISKF